MSYSLQPHGLHHARLPCPSSSPRACSNSYPLSQWCHPTISSSVIPFSPCLQSYPASGSFLMGRLFASGGQSIGASSSASVLPMNIQDWFPLGLTGLWYVLIDFRISTEYNYWLSADYVCVFSHFSCVRIWDPMDCSTPDFPVHHQLLELAQTHIHWVSDTIQLSHPLSSPSPAFNCSQHRGLFQWVSSSHPILFTKFWSFIFSTSPSN